MAAREVVTLNEDTPQLEVPQAADSYSMPRDVDVDGNVTISGALGVGTSQMPYALNVKDAIGCVVRAEAVSAGASFRALSASGNASSFRCEDVDGMQCEFAGVTGPGGGLNIKTGTSMTDRVKITDSGHTKITNDGAVYSVFGDYHEIRQSENISGLITSCSNSLFGKNVQIIGVTRSADSAFNFIDCWSSLGGVADAEFKLRGDGNGFCDGSWSGGGADYAEFFEWLDGNPDGEDRRGLSVVLDGDKIRKAETGDEPVGVVSARPAVVGDGDCGRWKGKYLLDDFGEYIFEHYTITEWETQEVDEENALDAVEDGDAESHTSFKTVKHSYATDKIPVGVTVPVDAVVLTKDSNGSMLKRRKLNPAWDEHSEYVSREDRVEWDTVGLMGKLRLYKGQPVGSRWIKMRDISDTVEEWLVR